MSDGHHQHPREPRVRRLAEDWPENGRLLPQRKGIKAWAAGATPAFPGPLSPTNRLFLSQMIKCANAREGGLGGREGGRDEHTREKETNTVKTTLA